MLSLLYCAHALSMWRQLAHGPALCIASSQSQQHWQDGVQLVQSMHLLHSAVCRRVMYASLGVVQRIADLNVDCCGIYWLALTLLLPLPCRFVVWP
jgi:hypothetical protein